MSWRSTVLFIICLTITNVESRKIEGDCRKKDPCSQICTKSGENEVSCSCFKQYRLAEDGRSCLYINADGSTWKPPKRLLPKRLPLHNQFFLNKALSLSEDDEEYSSGSGVPDPNCDDEDGCSPEISKYVGSSLLNRNVIKTISVKTEYKAQWTSSKESRHEFPSIPSSSQTLSQISMSKEPYDLRVVTSRSTNIGKILPTRYSLKASVISSVISSLRHTIAHVRNSSHLENWLDIFPSQTTAVSSTSNDAIHENTKSFLSKSTNTISSTSILLHSIVPSSSVMVRSSASTIQRPKKVLQMETTTFSNRSTLSTSKDVVIRKLTTTPAMILATNTTSSLLTPSRLNVTRHNRSRHHKLVSTQYLPTASKSIITGVSSLSSSTIYDPFVPEQHKRNEHVSEKKKTMLKSSHMMVTSLSTNFIKGINSSASLSESSGYSSVPGLARAVSNASSSYSAMATSIDIPTNSILRLDIATKVSSILATNVIRSSLAITTNRPGNPSVFGPSRVLSKASSSHTYIAKSINVGTHSVSSVGIFTKIPSAVGATVIRNLSAILSEELAYSPILGASRVVSQSSTPVTLMTRSLNASTQNVLRQDVFTMIPKTVATPPQYNCTEIGCMTGETCKYGYCQCPNGREGPHCNPGLTIMEPHFNGTAYMRFRKQRGLYRRFQITIEFLANGPNGLLMFSSDFDNGGKDYFAIGLVDSAVVFKFDCGSGTNVVKTDRKVSYGTWHRVSVSRRGTSSWIQLDNGNRIHNSIISRHRHLSLSHLYVGGFPADRSYALSIGFASYFRGCIRKVTINNKMLSLQSSDTKAIDGVGIDNCKHASCKPWSCSAGSECYVTNENTLGCLCPVGWFGKRCNNRGSVSVPSFQKRSFLSFEVTNYRDGHWLDIDIIIKPQSYNATGLLLYNGDDLDGEGDYFMLFIQNGSIAFQFDCGSGHIVIKSDVVLLPKTWNRISLSKRGKTSKLQINGGKYTYGTTPGPYYKLNMRQPLFVGGVKQWDQLPDDTDVRENFIGCIQRVTINHHRLLWKDAKKGINVKNCDDHPCSGNPCGSHGVCVPQHSNFACHCKLGFHGRLCREEVTVSIPSFGIHSYLTFNEDSIIEGFRKSISKLSFSFKSKSANGSILWIGREHKLDFSDYQAIFLENGHLICRFNLGGGHVQLRSTTRFNDGKWHKVVLHRVDGVTQFVVDGKLHSLGKRRGPYRILNVHGRVYLGFAHDVSAKGHLTSHHGFKGCVKNFIINRKQVNLVRSTKAKTGHNIRNCGDG